MICSSLRLKWLILEIFFFNVLMKICPWGSFSMKIFFYCLHFWRFSLWRFFILGNFLWSFFFFFFHCEDLFNCSFFRLKNCFSLLVLRLKIFVLDIWLRVIRLVSDFKMDANSGLEFGIFIDSGSELKFWIDLSTLVVYLDRLFAQLSWFCCFLMCL